MPPEDFGIYSFFCSFGTWGPTGRPDHDQQHSYHHALTVKPEAATAGVELLIISVRTPETR
jgi:hypothetical protein